MFSSITKPKYFIEKTKFNVQLKSAKIFFTFSYVTGHPNSIKPPKDQNFTNRKQKPLTAGKRVSSFFFMVTEFWALLSWGSNEAEEGDPESVIETLEQKDCSHWQQDVIYETHFISDPKATPSDSFNSTKVICLPASFVKVTDRSRKMRNHPVAGEHLGRKKKMVT